MTVKIHRLKPDDARPPEVSVSVFITPAGKWDVSGSIDNGDGESAAFANFSGIEGLDQAMMIACDWAKHRSITDIYVVGALDSQGP